MTNTKTLTLSPLVPLILALCTAVSVLSTDLFTPSIPDLPGVFGTDMVTAQLTVGVNLAAYSLAQLFHGPIADAYGRKRLLTVAFFLFVAASIFCALSVTIEMLLTGRFLQGIFSSVPSVVIVLIIRELYSPEKAVRVMALYGASLGIAPAIGPLIGGYLHVWFGWTASFWAIAILALIVLVLFFREVPETLVKPQKLNLREALDAYWALLKRPGYLLFMIPLSLTFGALYAYVTTAPVVFIDLLGLPTERYGLTYLFIVGAFIIGNILASRMSHRFSSRSIMTYAVVVQCIGALALVAPTLAGYTAIIHIVAAMSFYALGLGIIMAAGPIVVLDAVADMPQGPASALLGTFQLGAAALAGFLSGSFYDGSATSLTVTVAVFVFVGAAPLLLVRAPKVSS